MAVHTENKTHTSGHDLDFCPCSVLVQLCNYLSLSLQWPSCLLLPCGGMTFPPELDERESLPLQKFTSPTLGLVVKNTCYCICFVLVDSYSIEHEGLLCDQGSEICSMLKVVMFLSMSVCWFVCRVTQRLLNGFLWVWDGLGLGWVSAQNRVH